MGQEASPFQCPRSPQAIQCEFCFFLAIKASSLADFGRWVVNFLHKVSPANFFAVTVRTWLRFSRSNDSLSSSSPASSSSCGSSPSSSCCWTSSSSSAASASLICSRWAFWGLSATITRDMDDDEPFPEDLAIVLVEDAEDEDDVGLPLEFSFCWSPWIGGAPRKAGNWSTNASAIDSKPNCCWVPTRIIRWLSCVSPDRSKSLDPNASVSYDIVMSIPTDCKLRIEPRNLWMYTRITSLGYRLKDSNSCKKLPLLKHCTLFDR